MKSDTLVLHKQIPLNNHKSILVKLEIAFVSALVAVVLSITCNMASAEYITNTKTVERAISSGSSFLDRQAATLRDAALGKLLEQIPGIIKDIAKQILDIYAAQISGLIFGSNGLALEQAVERLIDEIQLTENILRDQISEVLDEVQDQTEARLNAGYTAPIRSISIWLAHDNMDQRFASKEALRSAAELLGTTQDELLKYISIEAESEKSQVRRLQLLTLQITAAQIEAIAWKYYYGIIAMEDAYRDAGFTDMTRFDDWASDLSNQEQKDILSSNVQYEIIDQEVLGPILPFYQSISNQDYFLHYIESTTSPILWQETTFDEPLERFDVPSVFTDPASWLGPSHEGISWGGTPISSATAQLDGSRWYYYIDVTDSLCLSSATGEPWRELQASVVPWRENLDDSSYSDCNRFWLVDPTLVRSPGPTANFVASFDQYSVWFNSPGRALQLHQRLVVGDLLSDLYGPLGLILDKIHATIYQHERPANAWDRKLHQHKLRVARLAAISNTFDYIDYDFLNDMSSLLLDFGATFDVVATEQWVELLRRLLYEPDLQRQAISLMTEVYHNENWLSPGFNASTQQSVPLHFIRLALTGEDSIVERLSAGQSYEDLYEEFAPKVRRYAAGLSSSL